MHPENFSLNSRIDVFRFLHPYDLCYTWKVHNTQKGSRIDIALANQKLISGVTGMKHTWNQSSYSDHVMVTVVVDFEMIEKVMDSLNVQQSSIMT